MLKRANSDYCNLSALVRKRTLQQIKSQSHLDAGTDYHQIFWIYSHRAEHFIC